VSQGRPGWGRDGRGKEEPECDERHDDGSKAHAQGHAVPPIPVMHGEVASAVNARKCAATTRPRAGFLRQVAQPDWSLAGVQRIIVKPEVVLHVINPVAVLAPVLRAPLRIEPSCAEGIAE
jgi:hypothetical protein